MGWERCFSQLVVWFRMGMNMNTKRFIDKYFIPSYCFVIYMQFYCLLISQYFMANIFLISFIEYRNIFIILIETPDWFCLLTAETDIYDFDIICFDFKSILQLSAQYIEIRVYIHNKENMLMFEYFIFVEWMPSETNIFNPLWIPNKRWALLNSARSLRSNFYSLKSRMSTS